MARQSQGECSAGDIPGIDRAAAIAARGGNMLEFLLRAARDLGPVVQLWPGTIMIAGPAEVHAVLKQTDREFLNDRNLLLRKSKHRRGSAELEDWRHARRGALAAMTPGMLDVHAAWLRDRSESFTDEMLQRHTIPNLARCLEKLTSASIVQFCFGVDAPGVPSAIQRALDALLPIYASPYEFPAYLRLVQPREWRTRASLHRLQAQLRSVLAASGRGGLAEVLRRRGFGDDEAIRLLTSVHLAAHGVPAAALSWALVELARNAEEQERAATAAMTWDGSGPAPEVLRRVVDETLRLWPPSWVADRMASKDALVAWGTVPAQSRILLPFWVTHRLAGCYQEPEKFDSQRWEGLSPPPGAYVPFGGGPRWCLGARFAHVEITTILAVLVRRTRISVRGNVVPDVRRTLTPTGFELVVTAR